MQLSLYNGVGANLSEGERPAEARWRDLQSGVRIVWAHDDQPIRHLAPRSRLPIGRYNSRKAGRMLHHQSRGHGFVGGEKLALMLCEIRPEIADFRAQHIRFDILLDGSMVSYFPDIVALRHDGKILVIEVKGGRHSLRDPEYARKLDAVRSVCADLNWAFEIWTDTDIAPTPRVRDNIAQIQMQRFVRIDECQELLAKRLLRRAGSATISQLRNAMAGGSGYGDLIRGLMCRGVLKLPLNERFSDETQVTLFQPCMAPILDHAA